jgi:Uracil DNA glycosylase superfamily
VNKTVVNSDCGLRSMHDAAVRQRRRAMLTQPHIAPLAAYAAKLRRRGAGEVPEFDPLDGGVNAQVLFLFEKPGPMTADGTGSGFISRNNDDPTAKATFEFMEQAGIPRGLTITWNVIPWWNGTRKVTGQELREGVACVRELTTRLPKLRAVVLVGGKAAKAARLLEGSGLSVFTSAHPSPLVRARFPDRWNSIPEDWAKAFDQLAR